MENQNYIRIKSWERGSDILAQPAEICGRRGPSVKKLIEDVHFKTINRDFLKEDGPRERGVRIYD